VRQSSDAPNPSNTPATRCETIPPLRIGPRRQPSRRNRTVPTDPRYARAPPDSKIGNLRPGRVAVLERRPLHEAARLCLLSSPLRQGLSPRHVRTSYSLDDVRNLRKLLPVARTGVPETTLTDCCYGRLSIRPGVWRNSPVCLRRCCVWGSPSSPQGEGGRRWERGRNPAAWLQYWRARTRRTLSWSFPIFGSREIGPFVEDEVLSML
jgi:hypothetical protein